jgi:membrane protein implicated in regulation of membrane protease activity
MTACILLIYGHLSTLAGEKTMLSLAFFILAVVTAAAGFLLLPTGLQQIGAFAIAALFLVLFVTGMVRKSSGRSWRA